jgi:hypothetical protein
MAPPVEALRMMAEMACGMKGEREAKERSAPVRMRAHCSPPIALLLGLARRLTGQAFVGPC